MAVRFTNTINKWVIMEEFWRERGNPCIWADWVHETWSVHENVKEKSKMLVLGQFGRGCLWGEGDLARWGGGHMWGLASPKHLPGFPTAKLHKSKLRRVQDDKHTALKSMCNLRERQPYFLLTQLISLDDKGWGGCQVKLLVIRVLSKVRNFPIPSFDNRSW